MASYLDRQPTPDVHVHDDEKGDGSFVVCGSEYRELLRIAREHVTVMKQLFQMKRTAGNPDWSAVYWDCRQGLSFEDSRAVSCVQFKDGLSLYKILDTGHRCEEVSDVRIDVNYQNVEVYYGEQEIVKFDASTVKEMYHDAQRRVLVIQQGDSAYEVACYDQAVLRALYYSILLRHEESKKRDPVAAVTRVMTEAIPRPASQAAWNAPRTDEEGAFSPPISTRSPTSIRTRAANVPLPPSTVQYTSNVMGLEGVTSAPQSLASHPITQQTLHGSQARAPIENSTSNAFLQSTQASQLTAKPSQLLTRQASMQPAIPQMHASQATLQQPAQRISNIPSRAIQQGSRVSHAPSASQMQSVQHAQSQGAPLTLSHFSQHASAPTQQASQVVPQASQGVALHMSQAQSAVPTQQASNISRQPSQLPSQHLPQVSQLASNAMPQELQSQAPHSQALQSQVPQPQVLHSQVSQALQSQVPQSQVSQALQSQVLQPPSQAPHSQALQSQVPQPQVLHSQVSQALQSQVLQSQVSALQSQISQPQVLHSQVQVSELPRRSSKASPSVISNLQANASQPVHSLASRAAQVPLPPSQLESSCGKESQNHMSVPQIELAPPSPVDGNLNTSGQSRVLAPTMVSGMSSTASWGDTPPVSPMLEDATLKVPPKTILQQSSEVSTAQGVARQLSVSDQQSQFAHIQHQLDSQYDPQSSHEQKEA